MNLNLFQATVAHLRLVFRLFLLSLAFNVTLWRRITGRDRLVSRKVWLDQFDAGCPVLFEAIRLTSMQIISLCQKRSFLLDLAVVEPHVILPTICELSSPLCPVSVNLLLEIYLLWAWPSLQCQRSRIVPINRCRLSDMPGYEFLVFQSCLSHMNRFHHEARHIARKQLSAITKLVAFLTMSTFIKFAMCIHKLNCSGAGI